MSDLPILIRPIRETDHALIIDSWVNSVRYSTPAFWWVPNGICKSIYRAMITRLIGAKPELFRVLVNEADEDQIFGWACGDERVTHFVFVKREFRRSGLASLLIPDPRVFTHWTVDCERIAWAWGGEDISYKPSLFRELINGLDQVVGRSITENDKHPGKGSSDVESRRDGQAAREAVGMVT